MNDDTNAQVTEDAATDNSAQQEPQSVEQPQDQNAGFQARVDELTKARREAERQNAELVATVARLSAQVAERSAPAPVAMPDIDPDTKKLLDAYVGPQMQAMRAELEQARMAAMAGRLYQSAAGEDPRVLQRAQELLPAVLKAGWTPEDAVTFARGELGVAPPSGTRGRDGQGRFAPQVMTASGAPPPMAQRSNGLPPNFDRLPPDKQLEILEKRGVADAPLFNDGE